MSKINDILREIAISESVLHSLHIQYADAVAEVQSQPLADALDKAATQRDALLAAAKAVINHYQDERGNLPGATFDALRAAIAQCEESQC